MLQYVKDNWPACEKRLKEAFKNGTHWNRCCYQDLVKLAFKQMFNIEKNLLNLDGMTEIDDGDYQGTLLYMIPFDTYQPGPDEYLLTSVSYGSCNACDTLQAIQEDDGNLSEEQIKDFVSLCRVLLVNAVKPYNSGWRNEEMFNLVEDSVDE